MFNDYRSYKQYFQLLAAGHPGVTGFVLFDSAQRLGKQRSITEYPVLELERPGYQIELIEGGDQSKTYTCRFSILDFADKDDWQKQEKILSDLEVVMDNLISKLSLDGLIDEQTTNVHPIKNYEHDNLWGWGMEFDVEFTKSFCFDGEGWHDAVLLEPVWVLGETLLAVEVDSVTYSLGWAALTDIAPVRKLAELITNDSNTIDAIAHEQEGSLVIVATSKSHTLTVNESVGGHEWKRVTLS